MRHGEGAGLNDGLSQKRRTSADNRDFTVCIIRLYYPLCVSCRIDTWQIVYLSNKDPCPTISVHKSEIKVH